MNFMFTPTKKEYVSLRSQIGALKRGQHAKYLPMAFTEQGVAMLSSVLNSKTAIQVNIKVIRAFTRMRQYLFEHKDVLLKLEKKVMVQRGKWRSKAKISRPFLKRLKNH